MSLKITESLFSSFEPSKTFRYHQDNAPITSLDFDDSGQFLISSGVDETMQIYDCTSGKHYKSVLSKKYGAHLGKFTHHQKTCLHASTKNEHTIRYLSLHDNTYIRYFKGHKALVTSLEINPISDMFISTSFDQSVQLWDLRTPNSQGYMSCSSPSMSAFDSSGLVFAIANSNSKQIGLYDCRNYDKEPFTVFDFKKFENDPSTSSRMVWNKLEFSNDGKHVLVGTNYKYHYILDAFEGDLIAKLEGHQPLPPRNYPDCGSISFSPDARYVFGGSGDSKLLVWDLNAFKEGNAKTPQSLSPMKSTSCDTLPRMVLFNPKFMMLASADKEVTMWLPDMTAQAGAA